MKQSNKHLAVFGPCNWLCLALLDMVGFQKCQYQPRLVQAGSHEQMNLMSPPWFDVPGVACVTLNYICFKDLDISHQVVYRFLQPSCSLCPSLRRLATPGTRLIGTRHHSSGVLGMKAWEYCGLNRNYLVLESRLGLGLPWYEVHGSNRNFPIFPHSSQFVQFRWIWNK